MVAERMPMPMPQVLHCPNCQAPLALVSTGFVVCQYCSVTVHFDGASVTNVPAREERRAPERSSAEGAKIATATFQRVLASNGTGEQATWYAAHDHGALRVDAAEVAHGAIALAHAFDAEHGTNVIGDAACMTRLLEGYAKLAIELRSMGESSINLPFFAVSKDGVPLHLSREIGARELAALVGAQRR